MCIVGLNKTRPTTRGDVLSVELTRVRGEGKLCCFFESQAERANGQLLDDHRKCDTLVGNVSNEMDGSN